jgi:hypothetical protein
VCNAGAGVGKLEKGWITSYFGKTMKPAIPKKKASIEKQ